MLLGLVGFVYLQYCKRTTNLFQGHSPEKINLYLQNIKLNIKPRLYERIRYIYLFVHLFIYLFIYLLTAIELSPGGSTHLHTNNT